VLSAISVPSGFDFTFVFLGVSAVKISFWGCRDVANNPSDPT
jgi:hypothetical protein